MSESVLLDTSFFIRLLNEDDPYHKSAVDYYHYFMEKGITMKMSTIAIAEFCVKGSLTDLPIRNLMFVPFNMNHATKVGQLMAIVYEEKQKRGAQISPRSVVPNDTKMFAQADISNDIKYFCSADSEAVKVHDMMKSRIKVDFQFIDIRSRTYNETFGVLNFEEGSEE